MSKIGFRTFAFVLVSLGAQTAYATADTIDDAVVGALKLCANTPNDIETARATLTDAGWEIFENAKFATLFHGILASSFETYSGVEAIENGVFMAASMLSNSSLGQDQIGMQSGDFQLSVLGIPEGQGQCIITGPLKFKDILDQQGLIPNMIIFPTYAVGQNIDLRAGHSIFVATLDDDLRSQLLSDTLASMPAFRDLVPEIQPVIFAVTPLEQK